MGIYMDNAATTRVTEPVLAAMIPYFSEIYGNPGSAHEAGRRARQAVDRARAQVARALGAKPGEILFTSCGTESDNLALRSAIREGRRHIVTTAIEHHAVLHTCKRLEAEGCTVTLLPVDRYGLVDPAVLKAALRDDTAIVSVMLVNNEIGTVQPLADLSALAHERGALFHTDAVQAVGHMPVDVNALGVDMLSLSAHKFHGPKGVGALYARQGLRLARLMEGGSQERGLRPGTENVAGIVGLGAAIERASADLPARVERVRALRDHIIDGLLQGVPGAHLNGHPARRVRGNINITFPGVDARALLMRLDMLDIAASAGSACTSGAAEPSHVLTAIGLDAQAAGGTLRLSLSDESTPEEADEVIRVLCELIPRPGGHGTA